MSAFEQNLRKYGEYHRDKRNVLTHIVGIPMIFLAVEILLSRPAFTTGGLMFSPAIIASIVVAIYYLKLDLRFGIVMALLLALCVWVGQELAARSTSLWLSIGLGLFVIGWVFQLIGHKYEGRKPAFMDDIKSLLIGPLFVVAEVAFMCGLCRDLKKANEQ